MSKNVYKSRSYDRVEGYGYPLVIFVDFPIGAAVSKDGWSVQYGSPFCYNENLMWSVIKLFKDITGAKVCRYDLDLCNLLYEDFLDNVTMTEFPTNKTREELIDLISKIFNRHPFIIQSMGGKVTMIIRLTLNEPLRIQGKTYDSVYNYMDEVWLRESDLTQSTHYGYSLDKILAWEGILKGNTERDTLRREKLRKGTQGGLVW